MHTIFYHIFFYIFLFLSVQVQPVFAVTDYVDRMQSLTTFLISISYLVCIIIIIVFIVFAIFYKRRHIQDKGQASKTSNLFLEILWSFIPFVIFIFCFAWGWYVYKDFKTIPKDSLEIHVYGQMWNWEFVYKNGRKTSKELFIPRDRPVKLIMTSRDVIHSFFIPTFRIKQDVLPGRYTSLWFQAKQVGQFQIFCAELCGTGHSSMLGKLHVMPLKKWENWLKQDPFKDLSLLQIGKKVFQGRCTACHKVTHKKLIGPGLAGLYNSTRLFNNAKKTIADENYLRESILNPGAKIVKTYTNQMTSFAGLLSEEELSGLIEYIKSLK